MRRTRHVVLPVRSWQYIGLLLVSLACVTFGLVARDREGQAGSLTSPELLHRAPHDVDVCPNLNIFAKSSVCLDLPEKQNFDLKINKRKSDSTDVVRIDKRSTELSINRNDLSEKRHRTINERRVSDSSSYPMKKFSRSLERINSQIENVGLSYRNSPNSERIQNRGLKSVEQRKFRIDDSERRLMKERRINEHRNSRNSISDRRSKFGTELETFNSRRQLNIDIERRNSRIDALNRERRLNADAERKSSRVDNHNREHRLNDDAERRSSRLDNLNRQRRSRNSRLDSLNRERRLSSMADRRSTRITRGNRHDSESFYLNSLRTKFTSPDNTLADQQYIRRENIRSQIRNIRFNLIERKQSGNRLEDQRFGRRMLDLEDRKLLDRRSRSIEQRNINAFNRDTTYLGLRRRISIVRNFEYINHRDNIKRDLINRLSRSLFTKRDSRGQIVHSKTDRSSEIIGTPKQNRYEFTALKRIVRSLNAKNLRNALHTVRYYSFNSSLQLDHTRIERNSFSNERLNERSSRGQIADEISLLERRLTQNRQHRIARIFTSEISNRKSFIIRKYHVSKQAERLSRSLDNINRLNSNERRESAENRRFRTKNDHSYSVLSTERQDIQEQRENLPRKTSILVLSNNSEERRRLNTRIQEQSNGRVEKLMNEKRRSSDSRLIGKEERLMVLRSRDHHRDIRLNLKKRHNDSQIRYIDSLTRRENSNFDRTSKLMERSRSNTDKRSSYRKLIDFRQSNSEKIRTSERPIQHRNTLLIPMIDHNRSNVAKNKENTKQFFDTNHKIQRIFKEFRSEEYGEKIGMISNLLKTNVLLDYNLSFEIIRQPFMIIICILYGLSMTKNNKLFTGNLMERITKLVLR
ncbi:PREDICTED: myosin heavy chain, striated muscle-like [Polistes canadensis]|uniref:myosin heavy chain, striated muscle-like n=1 Tax=Polistes canadensis TaxID=91411 RepID=UPI000718BA96|nr:PREDICTED: myosin heavy chain, striated muscle-like [Polistes canadensis]